MKRLLVFALVLLLFVASGSSSFAASPKVGAPCSSKGKAQIVSLKKYTCVPSGKKLVWSKPVTVVQNKPTPTPTPVPKATLDPNVIVIGQASKSESCKLHSSDETSFRFAENLGKGVYSSTGKQKIYFAFVRFKDYTPSQEPDQWINTHGIYFRDFYQANSYGKLELTEEHNSTWLTLPGAASDLSWFGGGARTYGGHLQAIKASLGALDSAVDFSKYDGVAVVFGVDPMKYTGGTAAWNSSPANDLFFDGKRFASASTYTTRVIKDWGANSPRVLAHEIGHTYGLQDLYAYQSEGSYSSEHRYVGQVDLMGYINALSPGLLAWNRWRLDWIDGADVHCLATSDKGEYLLGDVEAKSGARLIAVKSNSTERIVIEYRPKGSESASYGGLLVYRVSQAANGMGSIRVERLSADPLTLSLQDFIDVGQSRCFSEVCVTFKSSIDGSAVVGVSSK